MSREEFIPKTFNAKHQGLIDIADSIMRQYGAQGYDLSLRQLYYQFVAHHGFRNTVQNYKLLGGVISDARLAGELDWDSLVDRGRETLQNPHWEDPATFLEQCAPQFRIDLWKDQTYHVEVMVEKQALEGVLVPVCRRLDVAFTANKGYSSSSSLHEIGARLNDAISDNKKVVVIYLGDHDPSGIDMTRDVLDRLRLFSSVSCWSSDTRAIEWLDEFDPGYFDEGDEPFQVDRIALNMPQIEEYNPPPNPAKESDSRAVGYIQRFGSESWELDALDPEVLATLVDTKIRSYMDSSKWEVQFARMLEGREVLGEMAKRYRDETP